jgi:hypothetical protein
LICHFTDRLIQPQLRLTHQEPITVDNGTRSGREDGVDISSADGAYQGKATDDRVGERLLLAPVKNLAKITGVKVNQDVLKTQWSIDALSQKKGARCCWGPF